MDEIVDQQIEERQKTNWAAISVVFAIIIVVSLFSWRVAYYYQKVSSGEMTYFESDFLSEMSVSSTLNNQLDDFVGEYPELATDDDPSIGDADAKLVIVEFADFGCPYSEDASHTVRALATKYSDQVRFVYRDFPITDLHPDAMAAAIAGECAAEQDKFWEYHDKVFQNQNDLSVIALKSYAKQVGLSTDQFDYCLDSQKYLSEVEDDMRAGVSAGVYGTPAFFFNGQKIDGAIPENIFEEIIGVLVE